MRLEKFNFIKKKYGRFASWSIWVEEAGTAKSNMGDLSVLDPKQNPDVLSKLKPDIVFVGLNTSREITDWEPFSNFHPNYSSAQDYKTRYALQDTVLWGGYMTDIIKDYPELKGRKVMSFLRDNSDVEKKNIETFRKELKDLGTKNRIIIAFGANVHNILQKNLQNEFNIFKVTHYSHFINSKNYRDEFSYLIKNINKIITLRTTSSSLTNTKDQLRL